MVILYLRSYLILGNADIKYSYDGKNKTKKISDDVDRMRPARVWKEKKTHVEGFEY